MPTIDDMRGALWRAVGLTVRDLRAMRRRGGTAEIERVYQVAERVDALLNADLLAAAAQLHALTTKEECGDRHP